MAALLVECLTDELHLVVAPFFVGVSGAPRIVRTPRFPAADQGGTLPAPLALTLNLPLVGFPVPYLARETPSELRQLFTFDGDLR
jgi:hypothetical protein